MTTISSQGKLAYIYDQATDTWYPVAGSTNTAADLVWTGNQTFSNPVTLENVVSAKAGINNFINAAARDAAITAPTNGIVAFVRLDSVGNVINQLQYYYGGKWNYVNGTTQILNKTSAFTIDLTQVGTLLNINSSTETVITIPTNGTVGFSIGDRLEILRTGSGDVTITPATGVTINSKNGNNKIAAQYSGAGLIKIDTNTWALIGDLKA
jgi:hypothetical protein